jgi:hypothetical protein
MEEKTMSQSALLTVAWHRLSSGQMSRIPVGRLADPGTLSGGLRPPGRAVIVPSSIVDNNQFLTYAELLLK